MTRLKFHFTPLDTADFDVCAGPPRPDAPPSPSLKPAEPADRDEAAAVPSPAEG